MENGRNDRNEVVRGLFHSKRSDSGGKTKVGRKEGTIALTPLPASLFFLPTSLCGLRSRRLVSLCGVRHKLNARNGGMGQAK